jgi:hypothetical protein
MSILLERTVQEADDIMMKALGGRCHTAVTQPI